jgi:hypothetical protein
VKSLLVLIVSLFLSGFATGQTVASPEHVIREIMEVGQFDGHYTKIIGVMGDAAAVEVTRILAGNRPSSLNIDGVLVVLDAAFADPSFVENPSDRQPRTAMFVFQALDHSTDDPQLKQRIAASRTYVLEHYKKSQQTLPK